MAGTYFCLTNLFYVEASVGKWSLTWASCKLGVIHRNEILCKPATVGIFCRNDKAKVGRCTHLMSFTVTYLYQYYHQTKKKNSLHFFIPYFCLFLCLFLILSSLFFSMYKVKEDQMGGARSVHGWDENGVKNFVRKTRREETTRKTLA